MLSDFKKLILKRMWVEHIKEKDEGVARRNLDKKEAYECQKQEMMIPGEDPKYIYIYIYILL